MSIIKTAKPARIKIRNDKKRSWESKQNAIARKAVRKIKYSLG
jgi:hypothetical protein